jgi:hypothetical protein
VTLPQGEGHTALITSTLPTGDFPRATHLSVKMLRHYHELGLLEPVDVELALQQHFVLIGLSSLVVADFGAVLVASAPQGPGAGCAAGGKLGG